MEKNYINIYDNILTKEQCLYYISLIEKGERKTGKYIGPNGLPIINKKVKLSEDISLCVEYPQVGKELLKITAGVIYKYENDLGIRIPVTKTEQFKGRVYRKGLGHYKAHIDVAKPITYGRMITIIYYLNDIEEGGELYFENQGITVEAKAGRVVCFPPYWPWCHQAFPPLKGDRYIIRTFARGE